MSSRSSRTLKLLCIAWLALLGLFVLVRVLRTKPAPVASPVTVAYEAEPAGRTPEPAAGPSAAPVEPPEGDVYVEPAARAATPTAVEKERRPLGAPGEPGSIFGVVTVRGSGKPAPGVAVVIMTPLSDERDRLFAGPDGGYEARGLTLGAYEVRLEPGWSDHVAERVSVPVKLGEKDPHHEVDFEVDPGGRVWGKVRDRAGRPLRKVVVLLATSESIVGQAAHAAAQMREPLGGQTDAEGSYSIRGVPLEREWRVFVDDGIGGHASDEGATHAPILTRPFILTEARPQMHMDVTLSSGSTISGHVVDAKGNAISGTEMTCIPAYSGFLAPMTQARTARKTTSAKDGAFAFKGVPAGDYQILAMKDQYRIALKGTPVYPDGERDIPGVSIVLHAMSEGARTLAGVVVDEAGKPIEGAKVSLGSMDSDSMSFGGGEATSGPDGAFEISGAGDDVSVLAAHKDGYLPRLMDLGGEGGALTVTLATASEIRGRVEFPGDQPRPPKFTVRIARFEPLDPGAPASVLLAGHEQKEFEDPDGAFVLGGLAPGKALLEADAEGLPPGRAEVRILPGREPSPVVIRIPAKGGAIRGRVIDGAGSPVAGAEISVKEVEQGARSILEAFDKIGRRSSATQSGADGQFAVEHLAAGKYRVEARHPQFADGFEEPVPVLAEEDAVAVTVTLGEGGTIEGRVLEAGRAKPGLLVTAAASTRNLVATTDEEGRYHFERLPEGTCLVRVLSAADERNPMNADIRRRLVSVRNGQTTVADFDDAADGRTVRGRVATLPPRGTVGLVLLRLPGSPPPNPAELLTAAAPGNSGTGEQSRYVVGEGTVRPDGTYSIPGVPKGGYILEVYAVSLAGSVTGAPPALLEQRDTVVE